MWQLAVDESKENRTEVCYAMTERKGQLVASLGDELGSCNFPFVAQHRQTSNTKSVTQQAYGTIKWRSQNRPCIAIPSSS
jgi:hypothetical protein